MSVASSGARELLTRFDTGQRCNRSSDAGLSTFDAGGTGQPLHRLLMHNKPSGASQPSMAGFFRECSRSSIIKISSANSFD
jgi:hypothetical protein